MYLLDKKEQPQQQKKKKKKKKLHTMCAFLSEKSNLWGLSYSHLFLLFPNVPLQTLC